jgi:immune inhibitor A
MCQSRFDAAGLAPSDGMRSGAARGRAGDLTRIYRAAAQSDDGQRCMVAPAPELQDRIIEELEQARGNLETVEPGQLRVAFPDRFGLNDGLIVPGTDFPLGTPPSVVRSAAADRAPLRGTVRVVVVLAEFSDAQMNESVAHYEELFFSSGTLATGSVRDYFREVSNGLVDVQGDVVGPYQLPQTLAAYANGASGTGAAIPSARTMARDAAQAADADVNFRPYDNDDNGFVDAFIVVHAGPGAEVTGNTGHIWSHKWVLDGGEYVTDTTKIYAYLTIPEDARLGVSAHELGHLLFGWPDLYDTDYSSNGIGNWCLMAGGSWNDGGNTPAHPSAWCKANQGWVTVVNQSTNALTTIADVKDAHTVYRLWKDGGASPEYFLVENRQQSRFDQHLPQSGLLIWHIDDATANNTNESHYKVALMQADGARHLETRGNRGDAGDVYPGSADNRAFNAGSTPSSKSYAGADTCVQVSEIADPGPSMRARLGVRCRPIKPRKEKVEGKEFRKDILKESRKEKEYKEKDLGDKSLAVDKAQIVDKRLEKRPEKPQIDKRSGLDKGFDWPGGFDRPGGFGRPGGVEQERHGDREAGAIDELAARLEALEARLGAVQPFIGGELRPDLSGGAFADEDDLAGAEDQRIDDPLEKRLLDSPATG